MIDKIKITEKESKQVERAFYEYESDKMLVTIIVREFGELNKEDEFKSSMLNKYVSDYKKSFKKLSMIQNKIINKYIDRTQYPNANFIFDFINYEVKFNSD